MTEVDDAENVVHAGSFVDDRTIRFQAGSILFELRIADCIQDCRWPVAIRIQLIGNRSAIPNVAVQVDLLDGSRSYHDDAK